MAKRNRSLRGTAAEHEVAYHEFVAAWGKYVEAAERKVRTGNCALAREALNRAQHAAGGAYAENLWSPRDKKTQAFIETQNEKVEAAYQKRCGCKALAGRKRK